MKGTPLTQSSSWLALKEHQRALAQVHMRDLFQKDPDRFHKFSVGFNGILLDYSKNIITDETFALLMNLVKQVRLDEWIVKFFSGEKINITEGRAVLHTALRNRSPDAKIVVDGQVKFIQPYISINSLVGHVGRHARCAQSVGEDAWLHGIDSLGRMERLHGQIDHRRGQHRHRLVYHPHRRCCLDPFPQAVLISVRLW